MGWADTFAGVKETHANPAALDQQHSTIALDQQHSTTEDTWSEDPPMAMTGSDPKDPTSMTAISEKQFLRTPGTKQTVDFNHFINDTPKPAANIEPSPGAKQIQLGVDRFDGRQGTVPVFSWSYKQYIDSAANTNGDGIHEKELWVESRGGRGERESLTRMVPDQLFMVGPQLKCETSSEVKTTLISSEAAASNFQKSQYSVGYDNDQTVEVKGEANGMKAGVKKDIKNNMKYGASESSRDYSKAAKSGRTRSVFATVRATSFKAVLTDDKSLSRYFVQAVKDLSTSACTSKKAAAAIIAGQSSLDASAAAAAALKARNEACDTLLRDFIGKFGTDYITSAVMGGEISL